MVRYDEGRRGGCGARDETASSQVVAGPYTRLSTPVANVRDERIGIPQWRGISDGLRVQMPVQDESPPSTRAADARDQVRAIGNRRQGVRLAEPKVGEPAAEELDDLPFVRERWDLAVDPDKIDHQGGQRGAMLVQKGVDAGRDICNGSHRSARFVRYASLMFGSVTLPSWYENVRYSGGTFCIVDTLRFVH